MTRKTLATSMTLAALLALAPTASAAQRWAAPAGATGATCASADPCSIATAVSGAIAGDEIIVKPGTHLVAAPLALSVAASIHGQAGQPRPTLEGASNLSGSTLAVDADTTVSYLKITAAGSLKDALTLKGSALGENLLLSSAAGDAGKIVGAPGDTVLRDSVAISRSTSAGTAGLKLRDGALGGDVFLRNVTVWAMDGTVAPGILCETNVGRSRIFNAIVRGAARDIDASGAGIQCEATNTNVRMPLATLSPGLSGTSMQSTEPAFVNAAAFDFHVLASSPTVNAGTGSGSYPGAADPDGVARTLPDIGAYEYTGADPVPTTTEGGTSPTPADGGTTTTGGAATGTGTTTAGPLPGPLTLPLPEVAAAPAKLARSVVLDAEAGTVRVKLPGTGAWVALSDAANMPVGTVVDASRGAVTLNTALPGGRTQTGTFGGGRFEVRQTATSRGMTDIILRGGSFAGCRPARRGGVTARAASHGSTGAKSASRSKKGPVRRLWAKDKGGRFRTHGANSVATVRGTRWVTEDRCGGTFTRVTEGAVDVRDKHTGRTTRVRAGRSILVRAPRRR